MEIAILLASYQSDPQSVSQHAPDARWTYEEVCFGSKHFGLNIYALKDLRDSKSNHFSFSSIKYCYVIQTNCHLHPLRSLNQNRRTYY